MNLRSLLPWLVLIVLVVAAARCSRDPLRTQLPFGSTDLSSVEAQLAKLAPEDRARVEAYVTRSNGDYLPVGLGDPDMPFTARTFAEAIELERQWESRMAEEAVTQRAREAERERALAPLRAIVSAEIVSARLAHAVPASPAQARGAASEQGTPAGAPPPLRLTLRVRNLGSQAVVQLAGNLRARDREQALGLPLCYFEIAEHNALAAHEVREFDCVQQRAANAQERAFAAPTPGRFSVEWLPRELTLADGRTLKSGVY
jgi:hypothetical protein